MLVDTAAGSEPQISINRHGPDPSICRPKQTIPARKSTEKLDSRGPLASA